MRPEEQPDEDAVAVRDRGTMPIPTTAAWAAASPDQPGPRTAHLETEEGRLDLEALVARSPQEAEGHRDGRGGRGHGRRGEDGAAASGRGRRRRRRPLLVTLVVLLVLAVALAGGAVWAEGYARNQITEAVESALPGLSQDATVTTEGIILPQAISGSLRRIDVDASSLGLGPVLGILSGSGAVGEDAELALKDFDASMSGVGVSSPHRTSTVQLAGTVDWDKVTVLMRGGSQGLEGATASAGQVGSSAQEPGTMLIASSYHGVDATVEVSPSVTPDGSLLLSATTVRVGSQDAVSVSGNAEWLSYVGMDSADKEIAMDFLPQGLELTGAVVTSEGLRLTFEGRDVDLADL